MVGQGPEPAVETGRGAVERHFQSRIRTAASTIIGSLVELEAAARGLRLSELTPDETQAASCTTDEFLDQVFTEINSHSTGFIIGRAE